MRREAVRLDSTAVTVYHDPGENTLFRFGHSKDHRPELAQFKLILATLDPLGMPLATLVVAGNEADDGLYAPAILRARGGGSGRSFVPRRQQDGCPGHPGFRARRWR